MYGNQIFDLPPDLSGCLRLEEVCTWVHVESCGLHSSLRAKLGCGIEVRTWDAE
jgi:hypothetical protein